MTIHCIYCGTELPDDARFCLKCGLPPKGASNSAILDQGSASEYPPTVADADVPTYLNQGAGKENVPPLPPYPPYALSPDQPYAPPPPPYLAGASFSSISLPSTQRKKRPILWIALAIIVLILVAGIGGFVYLKQSTPNKTLQASCDASKRADYQASYNLLSTDYQRQFGSEENFSSEASSFDNSRGKVVDCTISSVYQHGSSASATAINIYGNGSKEIVNFSLVDVNGTWKISKFTFSQ